jgi:hypothetical protein
MAVLCVSGLVAAGGAPAEASPSLNFYVARTGSNSGNFCQSPALPCQTIAYAVGEQGAIDHGGTIHVAAGTYAGQIQLGPDNSSVTIVGASSKKTIIEPPPVGSSPPFSSTTDPNNGADSLYYVIEVKGGASDVALENFTVNGASGVDQLSSAGGCTQNQEYAGIFFDGASGAISKVAVTGIEMPADAEPPPAPMPTDTAFDCPGESRGVYVASAPGPQPSTTVTMTDLSMLTPGCTATTTTPLTGETDYTGAILPVKHLPKGKACKGWTGGYVLVDGTLLYAVAYGKHNIEVTGTTTYALPAGSAVDASNPFDPAYGDDGIVCADATTSCSISDSTVQGEGATDLVSQTGIEVLGASATISGNKVSANSYTAGGAGSQGAGIRLLDDATVGVTQNALTANDDGIDAAWVGAVGSVPPSDPVEAQSPETFSTGETASGEDTLTSTASTFSSADVGRSATLTESPSTTLTASSVGVTLPVATLNVSDTTEFEMPGHVTVPLSPTGTAAVTCTAKTPTSFTGCSGGAGTTESGTVTQSAYGVPLGYVSQYVSPNVEILSQAATFGGSGETITLGALPGQWDISGNTVTNGTALGASTGEPGYGDGIVVDSTDSCSSDPNENASVAVVGNTSSGNSGDGILALGASCVTIGTVASPNKATGNDAGLSVSGPGSACTPCTSSTLGYDARDNIVVGNVFSDNNFGVLAGGDTQPESLGGPPAVGPGTTGNIFNGNTWETNALANVVDFNAWGGAMCGTGIPGAVVQELVALTTAVPPTIPEGSIVQVTQAGAPTLNLLVTEGETDATSYPVVMFTPTVAYNTGLGAVVNVNPFSATNPEPTNVWGATLYGTPDSCDPTTGGSAAFQGLTYDAPYVAC